MRKYKKAYIEITNVCNLNCRFCPKTKRQPAFMDLERFSHVLKEVKPLTGHIYLHLMGEPLAHPELKAFLEAAQKYKLKVNITTNGTLVGERADVLLSSPALRKISFSLHCAGANGENIDTEEYLSGVANFVNAASRRAIICELRLWNLESGGGQGTDEKNLKAMTRMAELLGIEKSVAAKALEKRKLKLSENIYLEMAEEFEWPDITGEDTGENVFCFGLRDQFGVLADGTVVPCCLDHDGDIPLGNIFKAPLDEILNSQRAQNIYNGFSKRRAAEELCRRCGFAKRFD